MPDILAHGNHAGGPEGRGKPRIKGTRIPVALILGYLAADHGIRRFSGNSPT